MPGNHAPGIPLPQVARLQLLLGLLLVPVLARAEAAPPHPPCGAPPQPAYAASDRPPATAVWTEAGLRQIGWRPPACLNWAAGHSRLVAALAGDFRTSGSLDDLLGRLGAFSGYKSIRYWSATQQHWHELVSDAGRIEGPDGRSIRPDLTAADFAPGRTFHYFEVNRSGRTVYRLTVLERTPERVVLATENVTPIRIAILTAFDPGALQSVMFLDKRGPGLWSYYQMIRAGAGASAIALGRDASYVNRLAALYRYVAGMPTDREPPAAP